QRRGRKKVVTTSSRFFRTWTQITPLPLRIVLASRQRDVHLDDELPRMTLLPMCPTSQLRRSMLQMKESSRPIPIGCRWKAFLDKPNQSRRAYVNFLPYGD